MGKIWRLDRAISSMVSPTDYFDVPKGMFDVRMVYNSTWYQVPGRTR